MHPLSKLHISAYMQPPNTVVGKNKRILSMNNKNTPTPSFTLKSLLLAAISCLVSCGGIYDPQSSGRISASRDLQAECAAGTTKCILGVVSIQGGNEQCSTFSGEFLDKNTNSLGPAFTGITLSGQPVSKTVAGENMFFYGLYEDPTRVQGVQVSCLSTSQAKFAGRSYFGPMTTSLSILLLPVR